MPKVAPVNRDAVAPNNLAEKLCRENGSFVRSSKIPVRIYTHAENASRAVADHIASFIRERSKPGAEKPCVLGLATGSTPVSVYSELVRLHRETGLSFRNVISFNLDEYYPMKPDDIQSYHRFMKENLFDHIDIDEANIHIPDGTVSEADVDKHCLAYEEKIRAVGGIDIQLLGIGRTGHIGFNEPGSVRGSRTRMVTLDKLTRSDAASDFFGEENVPTRAITMGVGTVLDAREIIIMAFKAKKAPIVAKTIEGKISPSVPATFLKEHANAVFVLDEAASKALKLK